MWSILRKILGVVCIVLGLAALVTPLTPGSWLVLVGLELLGLGFLLPRVVRDKLKTFKERVKEKIRRRSSILLTRVL